jgi:cyanophycinase
VGQTRPELTGSVLIVGGGGDTGEWADPMWTWFVQAADSGKIINIDTGDASPSYPADFIRFGADSASHEMSIPSTDANSQVVYDELKTATGVFLEGGDQWDYVRSWNGTLVEQALMEILEAGGVLGGTSAGLAVLGEVDFDASNGTVYSDEALTDPYVDYVSLSDDFLPALPGTLCDSHFQARGRLGRLIAFLARERVENPDRSLLGIGVDESSALAVGPDGFGDIFGSTVTMVYYDEDSQSTAERGEQVHVRDFYLDVLLEGTVYDLYEREVITPGTYLLAADPDTLNDLPWWDVSLDGSNQDLSSRGEVQVLGLHDNPDNWWRGNLEVVVGDSIVPRSVVIPNLFGRIDGSRDYWANRIVGAELALARFPGFNALLIDDGATMDVDDEGILSATGLTMVFRGAEMKLAGRTRDDVPGFTGVRLDIPAPEDRIDLKAPASEDPPPQGPGETFMLLSLYPNPVFGQQGTTAVQVEYSLPTSGEIQMRLFNGLGQRVWQTSMTESAAEVVARRLVLPLEAAGVYFLRIDGPDGEIHGKIVVQGREK